MAGRRARAREHGLGGCPPAGQGLGDPLALERVDEPGRIAGEQHATTRRDRSHHPHLEPAAEPLGGKARIAIEQPEAVEHTDEGAQRSGRMAGRGPVAEHADPDAEVGPRPGPGEDPAVAGEAAPAGLVPQHDRGQLDGRVEVGAQREAPQDPALVDEAGRRRHPAGRPVGADHDVGVQPRSVRQLEARQPPVVEERRAGAGACARRSRRRARRCGAPGRARAGAARRRGPGRSGRVGTATGRTARSGRPRACRPPAPPPPARTPRSSSTCTPRGPTRSPHALSRGNAALSTSTTRAPARARTSAATLPAGPAPITATSARSAATGPTLRG